MFFLTAESCLEGRADLKAREGASRGYSPALPNVQGWGCHNFVSSFLAAARAGRARKNGPERGRARTGQNGNGPERARTSNGEPAQVMLENRHFVDGSIWHGPIYINIYME